MRRRELGELATEAVTAFTLLNAVQIAYDHNKVDAFVVLNAVAATALAIAVIHGVIRMRRKQDATSASSNVVGIFGGLAAIVEGIHKLHSAQFTFGQSHFALGVTTILAGLLTLTLALLMERLEHRRALTITNHGVRMRLNKFKRFDVQWSEIVELRLDAKQARLVNTKGKTSVVPLARLVNRDEVSDALVDAARERGLKVTGIGTDSRFPSTSDHASRTVVREDI